MSFDGLRNVNIAGAISALSVTWRREHCWMVYRQQILYIGYHALSQWLIN